MVKIVGASQATLYKLFEHIELFFPRRLEVYTEILAPIQMTDIVGEIMLTGLAILALATKEINLSRESELIP